MSLTHPLLEQNKFHTEGDLPQAPVPPPSHIEVKAAWAKIVSHLTWIKSNPRPDRRALQKIEDEIHSLERLLVEISQSSSGSYLDPSHLQTLITPSYIRMFVYRLGLSPFYNSQERAKSLAHCASAAKITAQAIHQSMQSLTHAPNPMTAMQAWEARVRRHASGSLYKHLWRCVLILTLTSNSEAAITCSKFGAALNESRPTYNACGQSLLYFLDRLRERLVAGPLSLSQVVQDEELMAYASADLQDDPVQGWLFEEGQTASLPAESPQPPMPQEWSEGEHQINPWPGVVAALSNLRRQHEQLLGIVPGTAGMAQPVTITGRSMSIASITGVLNPRGEG